MNGKGLDRRAFLMDAVKLVMGAGATAGAVLVPTSAIAKQHRWTDPYHYQPLEIRVEEIKGKVFVSHNEREQIGPAVYSRELETERGPITEFSVGIEYKKARKFFKPDSNGKSTLDIKKGQPGDVVIYDNKGGVYRVDIYDSQGAVYTWGSRIYIKYIDEGGTEHLFNLKRDIHGFNQFGYGKFSGNIEEVILSRWLENVQTKVTVSASKADLMEYNSLSRKGFSPKTLKGVNFLNPAEAEKMKDDGTIEFIGSYDFGVLGNLKLLKSDVDPVLLSMAQSLWLEESKRTFVGRALKVAKEYGAKHVRLITDNSPSNGIRPTATLEGKVQGGGSFLGWGINGQFSGVIGSNSDYSLLGACELYKGK